MSLPDITTVSISLSTTAVSRRGFGIPVFIGEHRHFTERVRSYSNLTAAAVDLPTGSNELVAATAMFSQIPAPSTVKIGRREADVTLTPSTPIDAEVFAVTVTDTDGDSVIATITATVPTDDEEAIVDALKAAIDGDGDVSAHVTATKNGTGSSTTLTLTPTGAADTYAITAVTSNLALTYATTEAAGDVLTAIEAVDADWYFVTSNDHTETYVLAMAAAVEGRSKTYFVSNQDTNTLTALAVPAVDIPGKLAELNYFRTACIYNHAADTAFTECAFAAKGAPFEPGTITWANKQLAGVAVSQNPTSGNELSATELGYLEERQCNLIQNVGGVAITRQGKVVADEWIDVIRSRDLLEARITEVYQNKLINEGKVPYTDSGIGDMENVLASLLGRYVSDDNQPNILRENNPFTLDFPRAIDVSDALKASRTLIASFIAYLAGAIHVVEITGELTL